MAWLSSYVYDVTRIAAIGGKVRFHQHTLHLMTKQRSQFGCGYLQTAQEVTEPLVLNSSHSRTSIPAITKIISFLRQSCSRRDARVDKPMLNERLLGKATRKIQMHCIEQQRKYLYSVVIIKTGRKSELQRNHQWYST